MRQSLDSRELSLYLSSQLNSHFPDRQVGAQSLSDFVKKALKRTEYCFSKINNKYFFDGNMVNFNHLHTDQYAMFLYFLANTIWQAEHDQNLANRVYYLNKTMHAFDAYYEIELPDIFLLVHSIGTVLGRANYKNYLVVYQRATVGGNNRKYPELSEGIALYANSAILGNSKISENCMMSYGTTVIDTDIPPNRVVYGRHPNVLFKETKKNVKLRFFRD